MREAESGRKLRHRLAERIKVMRIQFDRSTPQGTLTAPPSKSMAHRLLICGGLAKGVSTVRGIAPSEDVMATLDCLQALGAEYTYDGSTVVIHGMEEYGAIGQELKCRESGSTLRFFLPLCMLDESDKYLLGSETLLKRPLDVYQRICEQQHIVFENNGERIHVRGKLSGGDYELPGNISSQFITGLLFALPLCDGDSTIHIIPPIESRSYINLTIDALKQFGIHVAWMDEQTLYLKGNQSYLPCEAEVEGDYSNAAFFAAMDILGGQIKIDGLKCDSLQGDKVYQELFPQLSQRAAQIDISDCPDLGPVLMAVAAAKFGGVFTGTKRLKIKESDRGHAMAEELAKFGVSVKVEEDTITVDPSAFHKPERTLSGHNDHRIVMSLCVLLMLTGGVIDGAEAVRKSMPDFFDRLRELGVKMDYETI